MNGRKSESMVASRNGGLRVKIVDNHGVTLAQAESFKYLGTMFSEGGGCLEAVKQRVKAAWCKWRELSGVLCDRKMPIKLKMKVYKTIVRPVLLFGAETWAVGKREEQLMERTEMRMLRWSLGLTFEGQSQV